MVNEGLQEGAQVRSPSPCGFITLTSTVEKAERALSSKSSLLYTMGLVYTGSLSDIGKN